MPGYTQKMMSSSSFTRMSSHFITNTHIYIYFSVFWCESLAAAAELYESSMALIVPVGANQLKKILLFETN